MTYAPDDLLAVRRYLLGATGLSGDSIGIVAGPADAAGGGYHCGNDQLSAIGHLNSDYSKRESPRDRPGSNAASALDIGQFTHGALGLPELSIALVHACQAGDPRTHDVREIIYSPDGRTVHRFDALGIRSGGDDSHLFHTHLSLFRDSEGRRDRPDNLLGLLAEIIEGDEMSERLEWFADALEYGRAKVGGGPLVGRDMWIVQAVQRLDAAAAASAARESAMTAAIQALTAGGTSVDTAAVIARINTVAAEESSAIQQLQQALAAGAAREAQLRHDLAAALAGGGTGSA